MNFIHRFRGLKSLTLVNCSIVCIQGLDYMSKLEDLWLKREFDNINERFKKPKTFKKTIPMP